MTEYILPRLPAQSDARRFSTLSAPLLFCHYLKGQQPTTSQPTASQPTTQPELTTQQTLTGQQTLTTQQTLTGQRLDALTSVTMTGFPSTLPALKSLPSRIGSFALPCRTKLVHNPL